MGEKKAGGSLPAAVSIGIATKNRWKDLEVTLTRLSEFGLGELQILIYDDASDQPCPFDVNAICGGAELKRFDESSGYIVRRNQLARAMRARYYLSLDDDSFPVSGSLDAAVEFARSREDLFCLSFPIYNPVTGEHQTVSLQDKPYRVRSFIGCGHLVHRERFIEVGGYCEEFVHQGEEVEIAARAFQRGWYCYHFPDLVIHHFMSNAGRNFKRMDFYGGRNTVLWNDWFMPPKLMAIKQGRTLASRIIQLIKTGRLSQVRGYFAGLQEIPRYKANRHRMTSKIYDEWKRLPPI